MQKWFMVHPEFGTNPFYVGACSFSGLITPFVTQKIVKGNEDELGSHINIKGYVLASPFTDPYKSDRIGRIDFIHRASILSDELYEINKVICGGPYWNVSSAECKKNMRYASYLTESLYDEHILKANSKGSNPSNWCPESDRIIIDNWGSNAQVQEALHVREGTVVSDLTRCNESINSFRSYNATILSSIGYHQYLTNKSLRALIYSGDQELTISYVGILRWIKKLNVQIYDNWRPWFVDDQVVGYATEYSNGHYNLTYTTVKGAGHCPSIYYPRESFAMLQRWFTSNPL